MISQILQLILLIGSVIGVTYWASSPSLSPYNLQLTGSLVLAYFLLKVINRHPLGKGSLNIGLVIATALTILLVQSTGNLSSPVFFVVYILLFGLALFLSPLKATLISILIGLSLFYSSKFETNTTNITALLSLLPIVPLAISLSRSYLSNLENSGKIKIIEKIALNSQADSLTWIQATARPTLEKATDKLENINLYLSSKEDSSTSLLKEKISNITKTLSTLISSIDSLESSLKNESSNVISDTEEK